MNAPTITKEISKINTLQEAIDKIKVTLTGPDKDFLIRRLP